MATTRLTDVVNIKTFEALVEGKILENSKFRQSGLITSDPRITRKAQTAGFEGTLPFWKPIVSAEATSMSDDPTQLGTPRKVEQSSMVARMIQRGMGFEAMDIADYANEGDAIAYASGEFARLWVADEDKALLAILNGIFADNAANDAKDMIVEKHITTGTIAEANLFNGNAVIDGRKQLGDLGGVLGYIFAHSDVINNRRKAEANAFVPASQTKIGLETYMGYAIIETDNAGIGGAGNYPIYTTYVAGNGLFGYGAGSFGDQALAQVRDEKAGNYSGKEEIISRRRFILHPLGFSNRVAPTNSVSQTNAELSTAATWDRVVDRKAIPLVAIKTNG